MTRRPPGGEVLTAEYLARELAAGRSLREIGAATGYTHATVRWWLAVHGLAELADPVAVAEAVRLYEQGGTTREVAEQIGRDRKTITGWLHNAGVIRPAGRPARGEKARSSVRAVVGPATPGSARGPVT